MRICQQQWPTELEASIVLSVHRYPYILLLVYTNIYSPSISPNFCRILLLPFPLCRLSFTLQSHRPFIAFLASRNGALIPFFPFHCPLRRGCHRPPDLPSTSTPSFCFALGSLLLARPWNNWAQFSHETIIICFHQHGISSFRRSTIEVEGLTMSESALVCRNQRQLVRVNPFQRSFPNRAQAVSQSLISSFSFSCHPLVFQSILFFVPRGPDEPSILFLYQYLDRLLLDMIFDPLKVQSQPGMLFRATTLIARTR